MWDVVAGPPHARSAPRGELAGKRREQQRDWFWTMIDDGLQAPLPRAAPTSRALLPEMEAAVLDAALTPDRGRAPPPRRCSTTHGAAATAAGRARYVGGSRDGERRTSIVGSSRCHALPALDLGHSRALQHRRSRAPTRTSARRGRDASGGDLRRRRARRCASSPSPSWRAARAASRSCCAISASAPATACSIRLPNCLEYSIVFLGAHEARRHPGADVDPAHRRRGAVPRRATPGAVALVDRPRRPGTRCTRRSSALDAPARTCSWSATATRRAAPRCACIDLARRARRRSRTGTPPHPTRADDPAYLVYTSGTTGYPKGVLHAHRALLGRQPSSALLVRLPARAATACCTPASTTGPTCSAPA